MSGSGLINCAGEDGKAHQETHMRRAIVAVSGGAGGGTAFVLSRYC